MLKANAGPPPESDPLAGFARTFGVISGLLGILAAAIGVGAGLSGDIVLDGAHAELTIAAVITVVALGILVSPRIAPLIRSAGMAIAAVSYHLTLSRWWLPWIENYRAVVATGDDAQVWKEAVALPLLMIGGLLMVVSAVFLWPVSRRARASR